MAVTPRQPDASPAPKRLIFIIGLLIAGGLGYGTLSTFQDHARLVSTGMAVDGRMTGRFREVQSTGRGRVVSYYPIVSFRTVEGRVVVTSTVDTIDREAVVAGQSVRLRYDPADPFIVRLADTLASGPGPTPWILGGLSAVVALLSVWGLVAGRPLRLPF
jgi:hypothetical protein